MSEITGRRTVEYRRAGRSGGVFGGRRSEGETEAGRPLLSADEVRRLPEGEALVYVAGCAPIRGARDGEELQVITAERIRGLAGRIGFEERWVGRGRFHGERGEARNPRESRRWARTAGVCRRFSKGAAQEMGPP